MATKPRARTPRVTSPTEPGPTIFVLYGATGDLAKRLVLPAFYRLALERLLPKDWMLIGNGRGNVSHEAFRRHVHDVLIEFGPHPSQGSWERFEERLLFAGGGFSTADAGTLPDVLATARARVGANAQIVHYLAVPPATFAGLTKAMGAHHLAAGARAVYEKPFGTSPEAFRTLNRAVHSVFEESQIYRIDHFLGKEGTQNLHVLRFANELFASMWNREHIESVQIDVPETLGITDRSEFYDSTGAVLDMLVTHLFQVAAEVAMEPPASLGASDLQSARERVIRSFRQLDPAEVVLGQFVGYRDVPGIKPRSKTDTYVATKLWIDNPRWRGVPFLLRTGKRLAASAQRVTIVLRTPTHPIPNLPTQANAISFSLSGDGQIDVTLLAKKPGVRLSVDPTTVKIPLAQLPDADPLPPYVRLIHDVLLGDRSLFTRPDGLATVWRVAKPLLDHPPRLAPYQQGSWGPVQARKLAAPHGWLLGS